MKTDLKWILLALYCLPVTTGFGQKLKPYLAAQGKSLGFVNETYEMVTPPIYKAIYKQKFGYWVEESATRKEGYLSESGKVVIPCKYQELKKWQTQGLYWIKENNLWGLANPKNGRILFKPQFSRIYAIYKQRAHVINAKGRKGIIQSDGTFLVPAIYKELEDRKKGLLLARNPQGKYGYLNQQGKITLPFVYVDAREFGSDQHAFVTKDNKHWLEIDTTGKKIKEVTYAIPPDMVKEYDIPEPVFIFYETIKAYPIFKKDYGVKKHIPKVIRDEYNTFRTKNYQGSLQPLLNRFAIDSLQFPRKARRKKIQGKVKLQFVITEKGTLKNIKVLEGLPYGCNEEAIRVLRAVPAWGVARHGYAITSINTVEIAFDYTQYNRKGRRKKD
ncbi:MAG TPA: hypothetical protein DCS93_05965 [Microscillaceae bacterium]|nr:hypothetical protein [Microscillaceae bacterium]